jgi:hypothetical protein
MAAAYRWLDEAVRRPGATDEMRAAAAAAHGLNAPVERPRPGR